MNRNGFAFSGMVMIIVIGFISSLLYFNKKLVVSGPITMNNNFATEATNIIRATDRVYSDFAMAGEITDGKVCVEVQYLGTQESNYTKKIPEGKGYVDKDLSNYSGYVMITVDFTNGDVTYFSNISDGANSLINFSGKFVSSTDISTQPLTSKKCPSNSLW